MKVAVIAANGRTGREFVMQALASGYSVRAGIYNKNSLAIKHENLKILKCDATNKQDLEALIDGQDSVTCFIGHVQGSSANVQTDSIKLVSQVMKDKKVSRLISLTGTGVRFPNDKITLIDRILNLAISIIDPARVKDGINHVEVLKNSSLDWTVIRVLKLQGSKSKPYTLREHGPTKMFVSRHDVAKAALEVIENNSFIKKAPIICKPKD